MDCPRRRRRSKIYCYIAPYLLETPCDGWLSHTLDETRVRMKIFGAYAVAFMVGCGRVVPVEERQG